MFHGLKIYTVHTKIGSDATLDKPMFLREGFNWFAFLFTFLWALSQRLWKFAALIFITQALIAVALQTGYLGDVLGAVIQFAVQWMVGLYANDALRARLHNEGYIMQDIASGDSLLRAEQRYFDRMVARVA